MPSSTPDTGLAPCRPALLLMLVVCVAYANALMNGSFQFDDYNVIVDNARVHDWPNWWLDLHQGGIRPLLKFTYTLNWTSGWGVTGFHLTNLAIHFCNALIVFHLARGYLMSLPHFQSSQKFQEAAPSIYWSTALLFALHPLQTEAVTYICGRSSSLMTLFYLSGLLAYTRSWPDSSSPDEPYPSWRTLALRHVLTPCCFLCALATKETAVTFPFALLVWDAFNHQKAPKWRNLAQRTWTNWLLLAVVSLYFLGHIGYSNHLERSAHFNTLSGNLANATWGACWLLRQWIFPFWLNIDPDIPLAHTLDATTLWPVMIVGGLLILMVVSRKLRPWWSLAIAWFLLQVIPLHIVLPRLDIVNERQMYLSAWPLALAGMIELHLLLENRLRLQSRMALVSLLLIVCLALTRARNQDYRNEVALWEATARYSPDKARVHNNLGFAYEQAGRIEDARRAYERALQIDPQDGQAQGNLANLTMKANALKIRLPTSMPQTQP